MLMLTNLTIYYHMLITIWYRIFISLSSTFVKHHYILLNYRYNVYLIAWTQQNISDAKIMVTGFKDLLRVKTMLSVASHLCS